MAILHGSSHDTFVDLLRSRSDSSPNRVAFKFLRFGHDKETSVVTYQEIEQRSLAVAAQLQQLHCKPGSRAILLYQPGIDYIGAFLGCLNAGVIAVPAYPLRRNQSSARLRSIVTDSGASFALTTQAVWQGMQSLLADEDDFSQLNWLTTDDLSIDVAKHWSRTDISGEDIAFLQYTSGSTGNPKGVIVSHANLLHNSSLIYQCFEHSQDSRGVIWLPPYHDMGLIGGILQPVFGNFPVTLMSPVDFLQRPLRWLQAVSDESATTSGGPNFAYDLCLQKITPEQKQTLDLSHWKLAFTGAEPIRSHTIDRFADAFAECGFRKEAFYPCYGMAETTLIATGGLLTSLPELVTVESSLLNRNQVRVSNNGNQTSAPDSRVLVGCGSACQDTTVRIVDPNLKIQCPPQQVGEIWLSSPSVAGGYWNQQERTEEAFNAYIANTGEGPFLRTGDLGFLKDDELVVTGRIKDMTIVKGRNYYPQDLEMTVENCHPAIRPSCGAAFSVDLEDAEQLAIVYEVKRSFLRKLDAEDIFGAIRQAIAAEHSLPVYAILLLKTGSVPKTSSGKIRRFACKEFFLSGQHNTVSSWCKSLQGQSNFIKLKADIESTLQNLRNTSKTSRIEQETFARE